MLDGTYTRLGAESMRKVASLVGLAIVLAAAYWFDLHVYPPIRRAAGDSFDPAPEIWIAMAAQLAIAVAVVGLGWMLFRWSPPSRLVGLVYLAVGSVLVSAWPIFLAFHVEIPGLTQLNLYMDLGMGGPLLTLIAPFLFALGLVRLVLPLPMGWWRTRTSRTVEADPSMVSQRTEPDQPA